MKARNTFLSLRRSTRDALIGFALLAAVLAVAVALIGRPPPQHAGAQRKAPAPCGPAT